MGCTTPAHRFPGWIPSFVLALAACQPAADFPAGAFATDAEAAAAEAAAAEAATSEGAVPVSNMAASAQESAASPAPADGLPAGSHAEPPAEAAAERTTLPDVVEAGAAVAGTPGAGGAAIAGQAPPPDRVARGGSTPDRAGADTANSQADTGRSAAAPPASGGGTAGAKAPPASAGASGGSTPTRPAVPPPAVESTAPAGDCRVPAPPARPGTRRLSVFFTCADQERAVVRVVDGSPAVLRAVLEALLRGPTPTERAAGYHSFFSDATAGMLRSVAVSNGVARVDFRDFSSIIPNASSSAGSAQLIEQLRATIFQFPTVRAAEIMFDGSCDRFWVWLQRGCQQLHR